MIEPQHTEHINLLHLLHLLCSDVCPADPARCVDTHLLNQGQKIFQKCSKLFDFVFFRLTTMPAQEPQVQELIRTLTSLAGELEVKIF